jgi:hypothetical protein
VFIISVSLVALYDRLYYLLIIWSVLSWSFHSDTCLTPKKTHDIAIPFKRSTRHAHKKNFDSFSDDNKEYDDDEDSVLDKVLAHMSVQKRTYE